MATSTAWLTAASALAISIGAAVPAFAQESATPQATEDASVAEEYSGNEIVVTAQFRAQSVQDIPLAVTAVTGQTLEARGQTNLVNIGSYTPSVNLTTATAIQANAVAAFIRGIGQEDASFALEPGVGIYIDDVYYGTTFGASIDLVDLDRVEVLRGPQGTLAGKNSLGGAIKLYSKKPDDEFAGFAQAGYGRFNKYDLRGSLNLPIGEGFSTRFSAAYRKDDGYFRELDYGCVNPGQGIAPTGRADEDCVLGRAGGSDILTVRGAARFAPTGSPLEINIVGDYTRDRSQPVATKLQFSNNPNTRTYVAGNPFDGIPADSRFLTGDRSYSSYADYGESGNYTTIFCLPGLGCAPYQVAPGTFPDKRENSVDGWGVSGSIDYDLSDDLKLKSVTAYRHADGNSVIDIDGSPINILKEALHNRHEQFTQELRLSGKIGDLVDFTVGGFYYEASELLNYRINLPVFAYDFVTNDRVKNRSIAGFTHLELHPTEKLNFIFGLRYTDDRKSYTFVRTNADGTPILGDRGLLNLLVAGLSGLSGTYKGDRWDYRLGVNYAWTDNIMTYAQVSTGYKGGGINPRPFVADQVVSFQPETLTTYEGGFKSSFVGGDVVFNGAVFYNDYKGIQRTVFVCPDSTSTTCSKPLNAGNGRSYGAELEMFLRPASGWQVNGSLSLLDFKYKSINPLTFITLDMEAPFHNEIMASLGVQYEADLGSSGSITPRFDVAYQSEFFYQAVNNKAFNEVPARALANARLTYATPEKDWEVSLLVSNLFDKFYYVSRQENIANFGNAEAIVGRPREWMVSVKKVF